MFFHDIISHLATRDVQNVSKLSLKEKVDKNFLLFFKPLECDKVRFTRYLFSEIKALIIDDDIWQKIFYNQQSHLAPIQH